MSFHQDVETQGSGPEPGELWQAILDELLRRADAPESDVPTLSPMQAFFLKQVQVKAIVDGFALLLTPNAVSKSRIDSLAPILEQLFTEYLGRPTVVAVSVSPEDHQQSHQPPHNPTHPPMRQSSDSQTPHRAPRPTGGISTHPHAEKWRGATRPPADVSAPARPTAPDGALADTQAPPTPWRSTYAPVPGDSDASSPQDEASLPAGGQSDATGLGDAHSLNPKYTFDSFVIGPSNRFANSAAVAVAEAPATAYNPLFIWGGPGLGKTHLLHAIGNYALDLHGSLRIRYVSSEEFTNDYINSVREDRKESFKRRYRNLDILMIDDIQFLQGKEGTQEEFFHTFNSLRDANKQIVLSADCPPKELTTLEERLRTRFQAGLITDIQPPDLETRIAILQKKAHADGYEVAPDVLELIASRAQASIRVLEGALIRVTAYSSLVKEPISYAMAQEALRTVLPEAADVEITAPLIIEQAAEFFGVSPDALRGSRKTKALVHARQIAMYLCRELTDLSLPQVGKEFGGKDHTTVMYSERKIDKEMNEKRATYDEIQQLTSRIKAKARL